MTDDDVPVRAVATAISVLEALDGREGAGITEIADELGRSKSVVHNHLNSLSRFGYVVQEGTEYRLGPQLTALGLRARSTIDVYEAARPELDGLAETTGELAVLVVRNGAEGLCIYAAGRSGASTSPEGRSSPLHATATGKAMLAELPRSEVVDLVERRGLASRTAQTITSREDLFEGLRTIREQGIAFERGEYDDDRRAVAAAITDDEDRPVAAIGVIGPTEQMSGKRLEEDVAGLVVSKATSIEVALP